MSVATIIDNTTGKIATQYIPWDLNPNVPTLGAVLIVGNSAEFQAITNVSELSADTVGANNITGGEVVVDGGVGKPSFLRNYNQNRLTLVGENNDVPTSEFEVGTIILKGLNGLSTAELTTQGDELYVNGAPISGGGGSVGTLGQVLAQGNSAGGLGMTNVGEISATGVLVSGNPVYQKSYFPGVGLNGNDPEQKLAGSTYVIPTDNATILSTLNSLPGQIIFISASSPAQSLDLTSLPGVGSLIQDRTVLYFVISDTSQAITFILKTGVSLIAQPAESVRLVYQASYGGFRYIGM